MQHPQQLQQPHTTKSTTKRKTLSQDISKTKQSKQLKRQGTQSWIHITASAIQRVPPFDPAVSIAKCFLSMLPRFLGEVPRFFRPWKAKTCQAEPSGLFVHPFILCKNTYVFIYMVISIPYMYVCIPSEAFLYSKTKARPAWLNHKVLQWLKGTTRWEGCYEVFKRVSIPLAH